MARLANRSRRGGRNTGEPLFQVTMPMMTSPLPAMPPAPVVHAVSSELVVMHMWYSPFLRPRLPLPVLTWVMLRPDTVQIAGVTSQRFVPGVSTLSK